MTSFTAQGLTLHEAFHLAKQNTSRIQNSILDEEISQAEKRQVSTTLFPRLSVISNNTWRDEVGGSGVVSSFGRRYQHTAQVTLKQPLFQGGAEYNLLKAARRYPEIAQWSRQQEEVDLYADLAKAFYEYLTAQADQNTLKEQMALLDQRIKYLNSRVKIGRSKKTELYSARSQKARISAEIELQKNKILAAEEELMRLTGLQQISNIQDPLATSSDWETQYPGHHLEETPKYQAAKLVVEQSRYEARAAKGSYWPGVDLTGNYYLDRAGVLTNSKWDVSVVANWELYSGGASKAGVRIKALQLRKLELEFTDLKRNQFLNYNRIKRSFQIKVSESKKLGIAIKAAERNYQEHLRESRLGLVSDLDVLRALDEHLMIKRTFSRSHYQAKAFFWKLRQAAGIR